MRKVIRDIAGKLSEKLVRIMPFRYFPASHILLEQFFRYRMRKNDFRAVRDYCLYFSEKPGSPDKIKKISADYFCKISLDDKPDIDVIKNLRTGYQEKISQSLDFLASGEKEKACSSFVDALPFAGIPRPAASHLEKAFSIVTGSSSGEKKASACGDSENDYRQAKKIILSGMYWSGTGALYDFFREFEDVKALPVEQRLWKESDYSLGWGLKNIETIDDEGLRQYFLRLFLIPLTGLAMPRCWQDVLGGKVGINSVKNDKNGKYSLSISKFFSTITDLRAEKKLDYSSFLSSSAVFTDRLLNALSGDFSGSILPDNAVHIGDIENFRFFSNAHLVCVFRDPRSNYAARYHENIRFRKNPEDFIKYYRGTRENYVKQLSAFKDCSDKIIEVQFEDFILSEEYRKSLAEKLGLDHSLWSRRKYFRAHKSVKNVYNYRNFSDKAVMDLIGSSLKEYCV